MEMSIDMSARATATARRDRKLSTCKMDKHHLKTRTHTHTIILYYILLYYMIVINQKEPMNKLLQLHILWIDCSGLRF